MASVRLRLHPTGGQAVAGAPIGMAARTPQLPLQGCHGRYPRA